MSIQIFTMWTGVKSVEITHEGLAKTSAGASALSREHLANEGFSLDMCIGPRLYFAFSQQSTLCLKFCSSVSEVYPSFLPLRPDGGQKGAH